MYPYLFYAWSMVTNLTYWNVKYPDGYTNYQITPVYLDENDYVNIIGELPYARYFSYQVYDNNFKSLGATTDYDIYAEGTNCYNTLCEGTYKDEKNKGKTLIEILKNDNNDGPNTINITSNQSYYLIVYRTYDAMDIDDSSKNKYFGWIDPPIVYKNSYQIPPAPFQLNADMTTPQPDIPPTFGMGKHINEHNNFYKEDTYNFASSSDSDYLVSIIEYKEPRKRMGAIITGIIPLTSNTLYDTPRVGYISKNNKNISIDDPDYYEVRYLSFNMGIRSPPENTLGGNFPTIMDKDIIRHYNYTTEEKNRHYTIYVGASLDDIESLGGNPAKDLYLLYPRINGEVYQYVGIIYRQVLTQSKILGKQRATFLHGIGDIPTVPASPQDCQKVMDKYYPKISFYRL